MILEVILTVAEDDCHLQICDARLTESINFDISLLKTNLILNDYIGEDITKENHFCNLLGFYIPDISEIDYGDCTCRGFIEVNDSVNITELTGKII